MSFTYTPNSQSPTPGPATTLPNDGDALVVASVNAALESVLDNAAFLLLAAQGFNNVMNFGAVGDGSADDTAAINAALFVAGITYLPPGTYKITGTLTLACGFNGLVGAPGASVIMGHATNPFVVIVPTSPIARGLVDGVAFGSSLATTGALFTDLGATSGANLALIRNCSTNLVGTGGFKGRIWGGTDTDGDLQFEDCRFVLAAASPNPAIPVTTGQSVSLDGVEIVYPAAATMSGISYADDSAGGLVTGCTFDMSAGTSGGPLGVFANNEVTVTANEFVGSGSVVCVAVEWRPGSNPCVGPNSYAAMSFPFGLSPGTMGLSGTLAQLSQQENDAVSPSLTLGPGYETYRCSMNSTAPTITLPPVMTRGQRLTVLLQNTSGSDWSSVHFLTGASNTTWPGMAVDSGAGPVWKSGVDHTFTSTSQDLLVVDFVASDNVTPGTFTWHFASSYLSKSTQ